MRKLLYVIFCVGCMAGLGLVVTRVMSLMSGEFAWGFVSGGVFFGGLFAICHLYDEKQKRVQIIAP